MAGPLSMDLRERAMARLEAGESTGMVAKALDIARSTVVKWSQRKRRTGSVAPAKMGGNRPPVLKEKDRVYIRRRLVAEPHTPLRGLQAELAARGTKASYGAIRAFVHAEKLSFKKRRRSPRSRRVRMWRAGASAGRGFSPSSIPSAWSSSMVSH